jgi:hypothetical protein
MAMTWGDGDHLLEKDDRLTKFWRSKMTPCDQLPSHAQPFNGQSKDGHPDPAWWLNWVETKIYPQLGYTLKDSTRSKVKEMQAYLENLVKRRTPQHVLQQEAAVRTVQTDWPVTTKCKPDSHTLGSNGHQCRILM